MARSINSEAAFAFGAINAGVQMVTGYPGSPSSGAFEILAQHRKQFGYQMEWSLNEKVACEVAIGATIGGLRTLICTKSVGLNVMVDPLMALNLTPLNAGLVILLGDDPHGYGSQNDQDTRPIIHLLEIPLWEPATVEDAFEMMKSAFQISEEYGVPVIIRETRSFSQQTSEIEFNLKYSPQQKKFIEEPYRFVPVPKNALQKHISLQENLINIMSLHSELSFNQVTGNGSIGIIACGYVFQKLADVMKPASYDEVKILKLETLYPLPKQLIVNFLSACNELIVLEESADFIERCVKVVAWEAGTKCNILRKKELGIKAAGELFRWQIAKSLRNKFPKLPHNEFSQKNEMDEYPIMKSNCLESRYNEVISLVDSAASSLGVKPIYVGDPGCIFLAGEKLMAKYAIGSSAALASGLNYADLNQPVVAFMGDSGFFHTSMSAIANGVFSNRNFLIILIDNNGALTTGGQPTPARGKNAFNEERSRLSIKDIALSLGVNQCFEISVDDKQEDAVSIISDGMREKKINLIIVKIP